MEPVKIFVSYSHKDEEFKDELLMFLNPLKRSGQIELWNDRAILVGDKWDEEIKEALEKSDIIIFLLSPYFLASDYVNDVEIVRAMDRHTKAHVRLVPVMIRQCDLSSHIVPNEKYKISDFQGLPTNMRSLNTWVPREEGWMNVVNGLRPVIKLVQENKNARSDNAN